MSSGDSTLHGAGEPRQLFGVIARTDRDDGSPPPSGLKALVFVPRESTGSLAIPEAAESAVPGEPRGGSM